MANVDKNLVDALYALKQIGQHIGMYSKNRPEPQLTENEKYECLGCIVVLQHPRTNIVAKMACALILDYRIPTWRDIVGRELIGPIIERNDNEVRLWRNRVLEKDGCKCTECGSEENLEAHHIAHWSEFPELRLVLANGKTLCNDCHAKEHEDISHLIRSRGGKNDGGTEATTNDICH